MAQFCFYSLQCKKNLTFTTDHTQDLGIHFTQILHLWHLVHKIKVKFVQEAEYIHR